MAKQPAVAEKDSPKDGEKKETKTPAAEETKDVKPEDDKGGDDEEDASEDQDEGGGEAEEKDWREEAAGGDEKLLARLKRFSSMADMGKSLLAAETKLRERGGVAPPADDAKPEEKASWYTANLGRPEKVEDYAKVLTRALPEGEDYTEEEDVVLGAVTQRLHEAGVVGKDGMQAVHNVFAEVIVGARKEAEKRAEAAAANARSELEKVWPRGDVERNLTYANAAARSFAERAGVDPEAIANLKLEDGTLLGNHPIYARMMAAVGREHSEDPGFLERAESRGKSNRAMADRKAEIMKLRDGSPAEKRLYESDAIQRELRQILSAEKAVKRNPKR